MSDTSEQIQQAHRSGAVFGLSLAEVILIILFVILLLLIFSGRENKQVSTDLSQETAKRENAEQLLADAERALTSVISDCIDQPLEELPSDWQTILTDCQERNNDTEPKPIEPPPDDPSLNGVKGGDTTICTYEVANNTRGKKSVPIASIWIQNNRIIFLGKHIQNESDIIDFYSNPYDPSSALEVIASYSVGQIVNDADFEYMNQKLDAIGNRYETEERAKCRFSYNYYFEDITATRLKSFFKRYQPGIEISRDDMTAILARQGIDMKKLAERN